MSDFKIRLDQKNTNLTNWVKVHYSDEYNDNLWKRIANGRNVDYVRSIKTHGITSLVLNSYRIVDTGLHCRSRFEEAYKWCKDHDVKMVKRCWNDIEYAIAVCRGVRNLKDGSREMRHIYSITENEYKRDFEEGAMACAFPYAYKDARGNCWLRCWYRNDGEEWYNECESFIIEMATRFGIAFDYFENPKNGDRIFTFGRMA